MKRVTKLAAFTLIEMLIALVVVAMASIVVSGTVGGIAEQTFAIERRQVAHWVGENHLVRLKLRLAQGNTSVPTGRSTERARMAGRDWQIRTEIKETTYPTLRRVEVAVYELQRGEPIGPLDQTAGFLGR